MCSICFNTQHLTSENAAVIDPGLGDPGTYSSDYINGVMWGGGWSGPAYYFIEQAELGGGGWLAHQVTAISNAVAAYNNVCGINLSYVELDHPDIDIAFFTAPNTEFLELGFGPGTLGFHEVPDGSPTTFPEICVGLYNLSLFSPDTDSFDIGGFDYVTLIHELGHGLGLAHPHDTGGYSTIFAGVTSSIGDYGDNNQNQGIFTTMSYNDGWQTQYPLHNYNTEVGYGYQAGPMAFDIAALQILYGANNSYNTGNNTYYLPTVNGQNQNTYWSCIWDADGTDTISNAGSSINCTINLNAAPLIGANAGGYVSWNSNIVGGFTIANNVFIENATGGSGNDTLTGNSANNTLDGGAGNDTLIGGAGDDIYIVNSSSDVVTEGSSAGTDTVRSSSISLNLSNYANVENLTLTGSSNYNLTGNSSANTLTGNSGNNVIDGGAGNDTMIGGEGDDTYVVNTTGDIVTEASGEGTDTIQSSASFTVAANVENLTLTGGSAINGTGNTVANEITGNGANNILSGGGGNDTLNGGGGNDTLNGGLGIDTLGGGSGDDTYVVNNSQDIVNEGVDEGIDTIQSSVATFIIAANVENLILTGGAAINGQGNSLANTITGNGANNILSGASGNDTLNGGGGNDTLNGGLGNDTLGGGSGDDIYVVNNSQDIVNEGVDEGIDTIQSSVATFIIAANVENLILTGGAAINGQGNSFANTITGNGANNILSGANGNDTLNGGGGNDTLKGGNGNDNLNGGFGNDILIGGLGNDIFVFDSLSGTDTLTDFNLSLDKIHFDGGIFTSLSSGIGESNFVQAAAASDADDYLIYNASNDSLYYDADGSGGGAMVHIATLNVDITSHTSFELIVG